jgi:hypothetical protein
VVMQRLQREEGGGGGGHALNVEYMDLNRNVMKTNKVVASTCRSRCWPVLAATEFEALNVSDLLKCDIALRRRRTLAMPTSNVTKV